MPEIFPIFYKLITGKSVYEANRELLEVARTQTDYLALKSPRDERVLEALGKVRRDQFLPWYHRLYAFDDKNVQTCIERATCTSPVVVALMLDLLELYDGANVLEIGTGYGYQAAVIAHLIGENGKLTTVEIEPYLVNAAQQNLKRHFGILDEKIEVIEEDGYSGYPSNGPYHRICFATATSRIRRNHIDTLVSQLDDDGILLLPELENESIVLYRKSGGNVTEHKYPGFKYVRVKRKSLGRR